MARTIKDFAFQVSEYGRAEEYTDAAAIILAIKNILLSRKGNYPLHPNYGMNIQKYQFDILDEIQVDEIKDELLEHISVEIPTLDNVAVDVQIVEDEMNLLNADQGMIGITISSSLNSEPLTTNFFLYKEHGILQIHNETN